MAEGVVVHYISVRYANSMGFSRRLAAFFLFAVLSSWVCLRHRAHVVFATSTPLTICLPAIACSLVQRIPMVFEVRDLWPEVPIAMGELKNPVLIAAARLLESMAYRRSSRVVALAPGMRQGVLNAGFPPNRIAVIPNGADLNIFDPKIPTSDVAPDWLSRSDHMVLYAGTIGRANGVAYIPRLAAAIHQVAPTSRLVFAIIGDGACRQAVEAEAERLGVKDHTVFFLGTLTKMQVAKWMRQCSATIMTYDGPSIVYRDSVSNKFFDSLAASRPVIANFSGFSTLIATSVNAGLIVPKDDLESAARHCIDLLADSDRLHHMGRNALRLGRDLFSRDVLASDLERVLVDAVRHPNRPRVTKIGYHFVEMWNDICKQKPT